jgi:hypothetical protein
MIKLKKDPKFEPMLKKALDKGTYEKMAKDLAGNIFSDMVNYAGSLYGGNSWITKSITRKIDSLSATIDTGKDTDRYFYGGWHYPVQSGNDKGKYFVVPLQGKKNRKINNFVGPRQFYSRYRDGRTLIIERVSKSVTISRFIMYDRIFLQKKYQVKDKFEDSFNRNSKKIIDSYPGRIL